MTSLKRTTLKPATGGFGFPVPLFYKLMVSMMVVAMIPILLLGILSMGGTTSIRETIGPENSIVIITLITLVVVIAWSYFLAGSITNPIVQLTRIADSVSIGDLKNSEIELLSNDEIGELQTAFNRMVNTYKILDTLSREDTE